MLSLLTAVSPGFTFPGFRLPSYVQGPKQHVQANVGKDALALLISAALLATPPALAAPSQPTLDDAIVEVSQTSYPIIKALRAETFVPFTEKIGELIIARLTPQELSTTIALGIDVFNSVPGETVSAFTAVVKDALANLKTDSCTLVPLPSATTANAFVKIARSNVDSAKLSGLTAKWGPAVEALPTTGKAICLPPVETLDRLALAQADIGRSFGGEESRRLGKYAKPVFALGITIDDALPLLADAKRLTPSATNAEKTAFRFAGKKIESVAKREARAREAAEQDAAFQEAKRARNEAMNRRIAASSSKPASL